ncbi:hypothetical protein LINPERHAP2_LOCUS41841 [Linum perenne]
MERLYVTTGQSHITRQEQQEMHATLRSMMDALGGIHRTTETRHASRAPRQATHRRHADYPVPDPPAARIPSVRRVRQHVDVPPVLRLREPSLPQWDPQQQQTRYSEHYHFNIF